MLLALLCDNHRSVTQFCGDPTGIDEGGWRKVWWGPNLSRDRGRRSRDERIWQGIIAARGNNQKERGMMKVFSIFRLLIVVLVFQPFTGPAGISCRGARKEN
jgi:hypothetical protein